MFFKSDDKNDNDPNFYKKLDEELSSHLIIKQKPTQIKVLPTSDKNNNSIYNKAVNIKVKSKSNSIKSQEWHHS